MNSPFVIGGTSPTATPRPTAPPVDPLASALQQKVAAPSPFVIGGTSAGTPSPAPPPVQTVQSPPPPSGPSPFVIGGSTGGATPSPTGAAPSITDFTSGLNWADGANKTASAAALNQAKQQYGWTDEQIASEMGYGVGDIQNLLGTPFAGAWKDFDIAGALKAGQNNQQAGFLHNGHWVSPQTTNQTWQGTPEDGSFVGGDLQEYWVTKDMGKGEGGYGGGGSAIYEDAPYDRYDAQGKYLGSNNYKDMGTDGFTKAGAWLSALGAGAVAGSAIAASMAAGVAPSAAAGVTITEPAITAAVASGELSAGAAAQIIAAEQAAAGGTLASVKAAVASALAPLGIGAKEAAALALTAASTFGGDKPPEYGGGGGGNPTGTTTASSQASESKAFLDEVLPAIRPDAINPYGSGKWSKDANGKWTLDTQLNDQNQGIFDDSTERLKALIAGIDPNKKAPTLLDDAGGKYSDALAKTIYDRTMGMQDLSIDAERRKMEARLVEQGFVPGNEGYAREMARWEQGLGEMRNKASQDAQIRASSQALDEANFTNSSRTQGFKNDQELQQQLAQILAGARTNTTAGLKDLTNQAQAPTGSPGNVQTAQQNKYTADLANYQDSNASRNDLIRAILTMFS